MGVGLGFSTGLSPGFDPVSIICHSFITTTGTTKGRGIVVKVRHGGNCISAFAVPIFPSNMGSTRGVRVIRHVIGSLL